MRDAECGNRTKTQKMCKMTKSNESNDFNIFMSPIWKMLTDMFKKSFLLASAPVNKAPLAVCTHLL